MTPVTPIWRIVLPLTVTGVGMALIWSPLAATATRNLPPHLAGAGSGVYNTTRQVGSVLGSAGVAAFMTWRIGDELPPTAAESARGEDVAAVLPTFLQAPFSAAMSQTLLLPAFIALIGVGAALFFLGFGDGFGDPRSTVLDSGGVPADPDDGFAPDEDDYVEYTVSWDDDEPVATDPAPEPHTEPLASRVPQVMHAPNDLWHDQPGPEPDLPRWQQQGSILDFLRSESEVAEPIGFAHNGFHVDNAHRFQPLPRVDDDAPSAGRHSRHHRSSSGRHSRDDPDD
jgi:hypothetical protein